MEGRCACHEASVKWCGRHGAPLKLAPGDVVMKEHDIAFMRECLDPKKAAEFATAVRRAMSGAR